jgi:FKBP-type peptidyl-prolyl cis-trans isomerase
MRRFLLAFLIVGLLATTAAGSLFFLQKRKTTELKQTSQLPAYGDPLTTNQPTTSSGDSALKVLSGNEQPQATSGPTKQELQEYEQHKDAQQLLYGEIKVGTGAQAVGNKKAAVAYTGYLTSGQVFDKTTDKAFVLTIGAHEVIPGFEQGIAGMKVGGKRRLVIPPALGYGEQEHNGIPASSVLIFDVELLAVE